jgi:hypothetical protein
VSYQQRDGSGSLFRNTFKKEGSNQPDYQGDITIGGQQWKLSAWLKTSKDGNTRFMSINAQPKMEKVDPVPAQEELDDELPPF